MLGKGEIKSQAKEKQTPSVASFTFAGYVKKISFDLPCIHFQQECLQLNSDIWS